jgi:hypothetical protein
MSGYYGPSFKARPSRPGSLAASRQNSSYRVPRSAPGSRPITPRNGSIVTPRNASYVEPRNASIAETITGTTAAHTAAVTAANTAANTAPNSAPGTPGFLSRVNSKLQDEAAPETQMDEEIMRNEKGEPMIGRIAGGKHITPDVEEIDSDCGPIKTVDCDMPLTLTEFVLHEGKEYIVLTFATGDKENPFNWNPVSISSVSRRAHR